LRDLSVSRDSFRRLFGSVQAFVSLPASETWWVVLAKYKTVSFIIHFHAYRIVPENTTSYMVLAIEQLLDHRQLFGYSMCVNKSSFLIRMCSHVF